MCKVREINENIIFATYSFFKSLRTSPVVIIQVNVAFKPFRRWNAVHVFPDSIFKIFFTIFGRRFLRLSPLEGTIVSLNNKPDQKKEKNRCTCWVHLWHIEAECVFVGMEGDRGKYKIVPRFQISKGACLHAVIHKLRNWHLKLLKLKILFDHVLGNITFTLYSVSSLLVDRNSMFMNN